MTDQEAKRVALITGSGRDRIGRHVAKALAEDGFDVAVHYNRSKQEAEEAVGELEALGARAEAFQANVADENDVKRMFSQVTETFGRLDALVNTASIWKTISLDEVTVDDLRTSFDVNAMGTFLCAREAGRIMVEQETGGDIINFGDWAIERPYVDHVAYFMAKGSIPTLTRVLAVELAKKNPKVRVNCIHPGPVLFPPDLSDKEKESLTNVTLTREANRPDAISLAVRMFIDNPMTTGVCLPVDGGRTIYAPGSDGYND